MELCVYCASRNRVGVFFCEECGNPLYGKRDATVDTEPEPSFDERLAEAIWGPTTAHQKAILYISEVQQPIVLRRARRITIGRRSTDGLYKPDIDLTAYGALEHGVSRTHASIRRYKGRLALLDLESANGTFLNGQRLRPDQEYTLHNGDELQFSKLVAHIYLK